MNKLDRDVLRFIVLIALAMLLAGCADDPCDEEVFVTNSDGTTSVECVYYNDNLKTNRYE
tara:strand:+ start:2117 stop:2296 length:180 start_codon:yes stop_codon:yes gene_type:complete